MCRQPGVLLGVGSTPSTEGTPAWAAVVTALAGWRSCGRDWNPDLGASRLAPPEAPLLAV